jgi:hypothetical protein
VTTRHELAVAGIRRAQAVLGRSRVSALMTTTVASLDRVEEIVDEYLRLHLNGIFLPRSSLIINPQKLRPSQVRTGLQIWVLSPSR